VTIDESFERDPAGLKMAQAADLALHSSLPSFEDHSRSGRSGTGRGIFRIGK
jgi:hypothetical protein